MLYKSICNVETFQRNYLIALALLLFFLFIHLLKGLSHEIDFKHVDIKWTDLGLNKGRGWFLNFSEAPLIFG